MTLSVLEYLFLSFSEDSSLFQASHVARRGAPLVGLWQDRDPRCVGDPYQKSHQHHHHQQPATRAEGHDSSMWVRCGAREI